MLCGEALLIKKTPQEIGARLLRCRSWSCEICKPQRQRELMARAHRGNPTRFITLTVNPAYFSGVEDRARRLVAAWRLLRLRLQRRYKGERFPFFAVVEATKRGEAHLHILARFKWVDQEFISQNMEELIGAPITDVRSVKGAKAIAAYVAKYVGKAPHRFATLKRYWSSRDWEQERRPKRERDPGGESWRIDVQRTLHQWIEQMKGAGCAVTEDQGWWRYKGPPPWSASPYGWLAV